MSVHLQREIGRLKKVVLSLCALVEENTRMAVRALLDRDESLAKEVQRRDMEVDQQEVDVEEECLKILALHQPVAVDLRFVVSSLKINNDLERIGDLAVNIADKAEHLSREEPIDIPADLAKMGERAQSMLTNSIESFVNLDAKLAYQVCKADDEVDALKRQVAEEMVGKIRSGEDRVEDRLKIMGATRNLERIADHATNISEDVIYMIEGRIIRHGDVDL